MQLTAVLAVPNASISVSDPKITGGISAEEVVRRTVAGNPETIRVRTRQDDGDEGDTTIFVSDEHALPSGFSGPPYFEVVLRTPSREIWVSTSIDDPLLRMRVREVSTLIRIWILGQAEQMGADRVAILVGSPGLK